MVRSRALSKYVRISPRKARLAADLIRGLGVSAARQQLHYCGLKGGRLLGKTLSSAIANAELEFGVRPEDLRVVQVYVDGGPTWKRARPKCKGGRVPILKRTSHFTVVVGTEEEM
jgi:large subunit ribosomal protein L22